VRTLAPAAVAVATASGAGVGLLASTSLQRITAASKKDATVAFFLGILGFAAAPLLVASNRYSDAPSGSEVLFLITAGWGLLLAVASLRPGDPVLARIAGAIVAAAGVAGVVANWERPSSFSLFVRYRAEEAAILAAGVLWVALWRLLDRARREGRLTAAAASAAAGGLAAAVALAVSRWQAAALGHAVGQLLWWLIVAASAALALSASSALRHGGVPLVAASWFTPAVLLTAFTVVEQTVKPFGIQPILLVPAVAGAVAVLAGAALVSDGAQSSSRGAGSRRASLAAVVALIASLVSLALPALEASVVATRADSSRFQASFTLLGLETVGGWLAVGLAVAALAVARSHDRRPRAWAPLVAVLVAWPFVWSTPLHTLSSAIPWEIQVDYGSEFATIAFRPLFAPGMLVAVGGVALAIALLLAERPASQRRGEVS
jgi:hypothetical protein